MDKNTNTDDKPKLEKRLQFSIQMIKMNDKILSEFQVWCGDGQSNTEHSADPGTIVPTLAECLVLVGWRYQVNVEIPWQIGVTCHDQEGLPTPHLTPLSSADHLSGRQDLSVTSPYTYN